MKRRSLLAQRLSSRAYRALNRVCVGKARRVRNTRKSRGLDSIENKRSDTGMRFVIEKEDQGPPQGYLLWHDDRLAARIDWHDPVVAHGLAHPIKYARLVRRRASSPRAQGADRQGERYCVQLVLKGLPHPPYTQAQAHRRQRHHRPGPGAASPGHRAARGGGPPRAAVCRAASRCTRHPPAAA